ncbi:ATP-binding protein [Shewanella zhangzhouensis]|uniref:ATP-binding protein n=1 Tax=Shewanella zhangzhouensis TaxID=2864213 RepID=UPI001C65D9CC|nr:ATP-binding protein [Shewanella zhangzhouensis]QYK04637.1 two-component sensor histidine kinase [Shewanella zhangzhouensis]
MISIRAKLSLWLTGLVIVSTIIGLFLFESMLRQAFHDSIINRLEEDLEHVILATHMQDGNIGIDSSMLSGFYRPAYSGRYYQLNLPDEVIRSRSLWDQQLAITPLAPSETRVWQARGPKNHDMQLLSVGLKSQNGEIQATLTVAQDLSIGRRVFSEIYGTKLMVNLGMLLAMITGIFLVLRQSFKPLRKIKEALSRLRDGDIDRLALDSIPAELHPLAATYNELLEYTGKQIARSRNNLGNLSHGLKTPLAVMQQQVETLGLSEPEMAEAMQQQLDLIRKMIERKLAAARVTGDMLPAAQMQIPRDLDSLTNTLHKVHRHKDIQFSIDIARGLHRLPIHREDGMELIGNLLDNACKWARGEVSLRLYPLDNRLWLDIEDDGPGVADDALTQLTERGKRLDEAVMGHGIGLSIVKEICEQYELKLDFSRGARLGGLKVSIGFALTS